MRGPYRRRQVNLPPRFNHFKPAGIPAQALEAVYLTFDEFEAIRLADYQGLDHQQAADQMRISRPTFSRLIEKARHKVAQSLIEGKMLRIEGGHVDFSGYVLECPDCGRIFDPGQQGTAAVCPDCGSARVQPWSGAGRYGHGRGKFRGGR